MTDKVIIDWLSVTSKIHLVEHFIELIGGEEWNWQLIKGANGYKDRQYCNGVSIHYNGSEDQGIWLEMSGTGCRYFESYGTGDYSEIIRWCKLCDDKEMHITRFDIAFDDLSGILDIKKLAEDTRKQEYISKLRKYKIEEGSDGTTVYHGSPKSNVMIRIYDKASQLKVKDKHWVRVEMQLRDERAKMFAYGCMDNIGKYYSGVMANYLRYVEPSKDPNKWRWKNKPYWTKLLETTERISIYEKPGYEYNLQKLENYVYNLAGNPITTLIKIKGVEGFLAELEVNRPARMNPKYSGLLVGFGLNNERIDNTE